jgi:hypothetical protein
MSPRGGKNKIGIRFYEEKAKPYDLLFVWADKDRRSEWNRQGCAPAIRGEPGSVNWTEIPERFTFARCRRLSRDEALARVKAEPEWGMLFMRAVWMEREMKAHGSAVLPWPPPGTEWMDKGEPAP